MSLLKSKFNLCVLEIPKQFTMTQGEAYNALKEKKFIELSPAQDFGQGWVCVDDMFNSNFSMEESVVVNAVIGGYRYDKKAVPGPLLKKLFKEKLKEIEKEEGHKLEKADKEILKDECRQQLVLKVLPNPKLITWIWDVDKSLVYLDAKSMTVIEKFMSFFTNTMKIPEIKIKDYGLRDDKLSDFLDWIWKNTNNLKDTWIDQGVSLDVNKNTFKFNGPTIDDYLEEIESIKKGKSIKDLNIGCSLNEQDYSLTFSGKNLIVGVTSLDKITHESAETAVIDNSERIADIITKIQDTVNQFSARE